MSYCTLDDLRKSLPERVLVELTADQGDDPDELVVADAIAQAGAEIDAYAGRQYNVPFNPVPARIRSLAVDIAIYRLFLRRGLVPEPYRQRYEDAVHFLQDLARGLAVVGESGNPPTSAEVATIVVEANERVWTRESW